MRDIFRKIFAFMRPYMVLYVIGTLIYCSQGFFTSFLSAFLTSRVTAAVLDADVTGIFIAAGLFFALFIVYFICLALGIYVGNIREMTAIRALKARLFQIFVARSLEKSQSAHSGEGIAAINTDADAAASLYNNAITPFISCMVTIICSSAVVFAVDYRLGIASVAVGLLGLFIQTRFTKRLSVIGQKNLKANAESVKKLSDILAGALPIRAFNAQEQVFIKFDAENGKLRILSFKKAFIGMWRNLFSTVQGWLSLFGVFTLGGYLVATGSLSFPALMMVPVLCEAISQAMSEIGAAYAEMQMPLAAAKRVCDILDEEYPLIDASALQVNDMAAVEPPMHTVMQSPTQTILQPPTQTISQSHTQTILQPPTQTLILSGVGFKYENAAEPALADISLTLQPNTMTAIVGESGSGKSTLLRLITGLYLRDNIDMSANGVRFGMDSIGSWRRQFAYVDQSCKLFDMSIAENIALGTGVYKNYDDASVKMAAKEAHADVFIEALPDSYGTQCGNQGASLSGGQKQRIAIARALIRKAPILVFDEATSALDTETERQVMQTIGELRNNHTVLITTHHLNNITSSDMIIVMDKGRIAETGRHEELMAQNGLYKRLYDHGGTNHAALV